VRFECFIGDNLQHVFSLGEESRHVQVDQVGLGLARCLESSALVSKVLPELAQCLEYSIAHVRFLITGFVHCNIHEAQQSNQNWCTQCIIPAIVSST